MQFNFNSTEPIYLQVADQIEEAIFTETFAEGEQIPSTTEISKEFHINPATVLKGMNILVDAQLIEKRRGVGMFVIAGAQQRIVEKRRDQFYTDYVKKLVAEAQDLHPEFTLTPASLDTQNQQDMDLLKPIADEFYNPNENGRPAERAIQEYIEYQILNQYNQTQIALF